MFSFLFNLLYSSKSFLSQNNSLNPCCFLPGGIKPSLTLLSKVALLIFKNLHAWYLLYFVLELDKKLICSIIESYWSSEIFEFPASISSIILYSKSLITCYLFMKKCILIFKLFYYKNYYKNKT